MSGSDDRILRKVYFIKRAADGDETVTLLKNKFKICDAIRDVIEWMDEGRDFQLSLRAWALPALPEEGKPTTGLFASDPWAEEEDALADELALEFSHWAPPTRNQQAAFEAFRAMLHWLHEDKAFDINLIPSHPIPPVNLN